MAQNGVSEDRKPVRKTQIEKLIKKHGNHLLLDFNISDDDLINTQFTINQESLEKTIENYLVNEIKKINAIFTRDTKTDNIYFLDRFLITTPHDTRTLPTTKEEIDTLRARILQNMSDTNDVDMKSLDSLMELYNITDEVDKCLYLKYVFECIDNVDYNTTNKSLKLSSTTSDDSYFFIHYLLTMCYLLKLSVVDGVQVLMDFKSIDDERKFQVDYSDSESLLRMDHEIGTFLKSEGQDNTWDELIKTLASLQLNVLIKPRGAAQKPLAPPTTEHKWTPTQTQTRTQNFDGTTSPTHVAHRGRNSIGHATQAHKTGSKEKKYLKYKRKYLLLKNKI